MVEMYREAAKDFIGKTKKQRRALIREGTWKKVEERKKIKGKVESAKSDRLKERLKTEYTEKDREVKRGVPERIGETRRRRKQKQLRRLLRMGGARSYIPSRRC